MKAALYIHIPFCLKKCGYCDFYSIEKDADLISQFVRSLKKEIILYHQHPDIKKLEFGTIYFGGGTPSVLTINHLETIIDALFLNFHFSGNIEITVEVNPETVDLKKFEDFRAVGVNRVSIGVQSLNDGELKILDRLHSAETAKSGVIQAQKAKFENISIDLIFAIPGQTPDSWEKTLNKALSLNPQHVSMYGLTYEKGTPLKLQLRTGKIQRVNESLESTMYLKGVETLESQGIQQYEISNFAMPGFSSRHNQMYWDGSPYLGLGPSAHSYWNNIRQWNVSNVMKYINFINKESYAVEDKEDLTDDRQLLEFIMLGLRTTKGLDLDLFQNRFSFDFPDKYQKSLNLLDSYKDDKLYKYEHNRIKLTKHGFLLYDEVCSYFV